MEDDEIIIGIEKPVAKNSKSKKKTKKKKNTKKTNKKKNVKNQKELNPLKVIAFIIIFVVLVAVLLASGLFDISEITVEGNSKLSEERVISLSSIELYTNIFNVNKSRTIAKIKENPYIEEVKISRKLPSNLVITVKERVPTYMLQVADSYVYINNQGYMLEISNEMIEVPILTGFTTDLSNIKAGNRINSEDLKKMNMIIKIYQILSNNGISENLSKVDMSNERNYTIYFEKEGKKVYLGNGSDLNTKILVLKSLLEASSGKTGEIFLNVDLNTERAYFRENV